MGKVEKKVYWAIDEIDEKIAALENIETGEKRYIEKLYLGKMAKEGDLVYEEDGEAGGYQVDEVATEDRKAYMKALLSRARKNTKEP